MTAGNTKGETMQAPRLIRSGWWVAVAGGLVCVVVLIALVKSPGTPGVVAVGDGQSTASYGFDLNPCLVTQSDIVASGMPRDGVQPLDHPLMAPASDIARLNEEGRGKFLVPGDRVIGIEIGGEARAYPLRLMRWHEIVNDTVGGEPIAVTYNPLCDSVVVVSRNVGAETLDFGVSGLLLDSNLLMYDRRTEPGSESLWSQLQARAIAGPAAAQHAHLEVLAGQLTTWQQWQTMYPDTVVMAANPEFKRLYKRDPYHSYFGSEILRFPVEPLPPTDDLKLKDRVVAIRVGEEEAVFALPHIAAAVGANRGAWDIEVGGVPLRLDLDLEAGAVAVNVLDGSEADLSLRHAFWFAWYAAGR